VSGHNLGHFLLLLDGQVEVGEDPTDRPGEEFTLGFGESYSAFFDTSGDRCFAHVGEVFAFLRVQLVPDGWLRFRRVCGSPVFAACFLAQFGAAPNERGFVEFVDFRLQPCDVACGAVHFFEERDGWVYVAGQAEGCLCFR
jgi:hypothetical protein